MSRIFGALKIIVVLLLDFMGIYAVFQDLYIASIVVGIITLYVLFGGYIALMKDGAVNAENLPMYQRSRFETAKTQLVSDVKSISNDNISKLKLYLVPGDDELNATAYGFNCVSVTQGTFNNVDPITLNAILAHEISHILNLDAEFNRVIFCSVTILIGALSMMSFVTVVIIFLLFLILRGFRSWLGVMAFQGTTKVISGLFGLLQRGIVMIYRSLLGLASRHAEYRSDKYSFMLGYNVQLLHFLSIAESNSKRQLTLSEAIHHSHPPTVKRIARLEKLMLTESIIDISDE